MISFQEFVENMESQTRPDQKLVANFMRAVGESRQKLVEMHRVVGEAIRKTVKTETLIDYMKRMCNLLGEWLTPFDHKPVFPNGYEFRLINSGGLQQFTSGQNSHSHMERMIREGKLKELEQIIQGAEEELTSHYKNASGHQDNRSMIARFNPPQQR